MKKSTILNRKENNEFGIQEEIQGLLHKAYTWHYYDKQDEKKRKTELKTHSQRTAGLNLALGLVQSCTSLPSRSLVVQMVRASA